VASRYSLQFPRPVWILVILLDLRPTIQAILTVESQVSFEDDGMDGESILPLFEAPLNWTRSKALLICQPVYPPTQALRTFLPSSEICRKFAFYRGKWKIMASLSSNQGAKMFDMDTDKEERARRVKIRNRGEFDSMLVQARETAGNVIESFNSNCNM
jgi:hypothetical protein